MKKEIGRRALENEDGATVVEFALIAPVLFAAIFGFINVGLMIFSASSLHYAVQQASRCASVMTTTCTNSTTTAAYAATQYYGPSIDAVFTYSTAGCGNTVSGTGTYVLNAVVAEWSVPLSATACFP